VKLEALQQLRRRLLDQRSTLLERWRQALSDENELLVACGPDGQDAASVVSVATVIEAVSAPQRSALARIQSSLARIDRGTYDECVACHGKIDEARLRAVPDTDRCDRCAPRLN
jgi:DnaK suppressor protein